MKKEDRFNEEINPDGSRVVRVVKDLKIVDIKKNDENF